MISELIHGRRKGFLVVPEGKTRSGWRGFGFHLRKAIAPGSLATKQPFHSVLRPIVENHKTFLQAAVEGDRREGGGSRKGKQLMREFQISTESNLSNKSHDICDLNAGKKQANSKAKLSVEITESNSGVNDSPLTLDVGLRLERGPDGEWEVIWSKVKELGRKEKPKDKNFKPEDISQFKPTAPFNAKPKFNPKPITVWRPKRKQTLQNGKTQPDHLISASTSSVSDPRRGDVDSNSELPPADSQSLLRLAQSMKVSDGAGSDLLGADEPDNEILSSDESNTAFRSSDEPDESDELAKTSDGEEKLHQDIRLILQENTGNVSKKWGNSEQLVLELRDGRRVAVPIQISLPPGEVTEVLEEQTQLALVPLKCPDVVEVSSAQVDENDVFVEDWVSDTCSESSVLPNVGGLSPLSVEQLMVVHKLLIYRATSIFQHNKSYYI
ncbi:hypothetical protein CFP56_031323 [Quercus suber]|uniref:Uncharacterized protein n=1 Tax=Quercus suber TaxID=58331 RepID=A0AAW0JLR0_QUESU